MARKPRMYLPGIPAHVVQRGNYLLTSYRYIELNPVAAGMVTTPDEYRWPSYGCHAWGKTNTLITDYPIFEALDQSILERQHAYRELFRFQLPMQIFIRFVRA